MEFDGKSSIDLVSYFCVYLLFNVHVSTFHHIILPNVMGGAVSVTRPPSPTARVPTTVPWPATAGAAITSAVPGYRSIMFSVIYMIYIIMLMLFTFSFRSISTLPFML